jgi:hypothetical protein
MRLLGEDGCVVKVGTYTSERALVSDFCLALCVSGHDGEGIRYGARKWRRWEDSAGICGTGFTHLDLRSLSRNCCLLRFFSLCCGLSCTAKLF